LSASRIAMLCLMGPETGQADRAATDVELLGEPTAPNA
jgi:hypothetical protein